MTVSYDKAAAVIVLPRIGGGRLRDPKLRKWLARSQLSKRDQPLELLAEVLSEIGKPVPTQGLAALRLWGQTRDRPSAWIAAADPVYLEPRLDQLRLHALRRNGVPPADLRPLIDHLQGTLGRDASLGFIRMGSYGYITATEPFASAELPAYAVHSQSPEDFLPRGDGSERHRRLLSEIEMSLHDHEVNVARQAAGDPPINSLWIWGGGIAPDAKTERLPPLFSDDPLLAGHWESRAGMVEPWPGKLSGCVDVADAGFIATTPEFNEDIEELENHLRELQDMLMSGRVSKLTLLFRDGIRANIQRRHSLRFWRRGNTLTEIESK